jgi:hypothetical protein
MRGLDLIDSELAYRKRSRGADIPLGTTASVNIVSQSLEFTGTTDAREFA